MKKKAIVISVIFVISLTAIAVAAVLVPHYDENHLDMAIMSDTHVLSAEQMGTELTPSLQAQENKGQKMLVLSEALLKEGIDAVIEAKQEVLIVSGDLTDDGGKSSHEAVAGQLRRAEESGVACYVINGNHDINNSAKSYEGENPTAAENVSAEEFAEIYADFGYNEALDRHSDSLSYTADLNNRYRLLAIDCSYYEINREDGYVDGRHDSYTSESLINWIETSLIKAREDGKQVLAMMHFPLAQHLGDLLGGNSVTADKNEEICDLFFEYGVNFVFTGHLHSQDISAINNDRGKTIYDVETASLANYPMPIRFFKGDRRSERLTTKYLSSIKESYIPALIPSDIKAQILNDLTAYSEMSVDRGMKIKIMGKIETSTIVSLLGQFGLDKTSPDTIELAEDIRENLIEDFFDTPIYKNGTGKSIEDICESFGVSLPSSDYTTVWSVAMQFLRANYRGSESYKATDTEGILLKYSIYTAFYKIAEYDLFAKINLYNSQVAAIDLAPAMEKLFKEGKLDVVDNQLLGILGSIEKLVSFQERWSNKPFIGSLIAGLDLSDPAMILNFVKSVIDLKNKLKLDLTVLLGEGGSENILNIINGIQIDKLIDFEEGTLNIGYLCTDMLFGELGANLITDRLPADDEFQVIYK